MSPTLGDLLLNWVSCFREIRTARVQAGAARLRAAPVDYDRDDPRRDRYRKDAKRLTWGLPRLMHVEVDRRDRFRVVPPCLVSAESGRHFLAGARDQALIDRLEEATGAEVLRDPQDDAPSVVFFEADEEIAIAVAEELRIARVRDRGLELLASLPALAGLLRDAPREGLPDACERWEQDGDTCRFGRWVSVERGTVGPGLYRTVRKPRQWYLAPEGSAETFRLDSHERRWAAAWSLASDRRVLLGRDGGLLVPRTTFGLPLLIERALILASGRLPRVDAAGRTYHEIDLERARRLARVVGARLEEKA